MLHMNYQIPLGGIDADNMIHFITEGGNRELKDRRWIIPDGVRHHLEKVKADNKKEEMTSNHTTKEAYDHLEYILSLDNGIDYNEMKRIKNWFAKNSNATKTKQYELYGGSIMNTWVVNALNTATRNAKSNKEADQAAGIKTRDKDERDTGLKATVDDKTPTYNPATLNKLNRLKELSNIKENRIIILTEAQTKEIREKLFINNKK